MTSPTAFLLMQYFLAQWAVKASLSPYQLATVQLYNRRLKGRTDMRLRDTVLPVLLLLCLPRSNAATRLQKLHRRGGQSENVPKICFRRGRTVLLRKSDADCCHVLAEAGHSKPRQLPVVLWHGMGDSCCNSWSIGGVRLKIMDALPGLVQLPGSRRSSLLLGPSDTLFDPLYPFCCALQASLCTA